MKKPICQQIFGEKKHEKKTHIWRKKTAEWISQKTSPPPPPPKEISTRKGSEEKSRPTEEESLPKKTFNWDFCQKLCEDVWRGNNNNNNNNNNNQEDDHDDDDDDGDGDGDGDGDDDDDNDDDDDDADDDDDDDDAEEKTKNNHNNIITTTTAAKATPPCPALPAEALAIKFVFKKCFEHIESTSWKHLKTACAQSHWIFVDLSRHRERMINPKRALDSMSAAAWAKKIKLSSVHCSTLDMAKWCQMRPNIFVCWNHMTCTVYTAYTCKVLWFVKFHGFSTLSFDFLRMRLELPGTNWQNDTGMIWWYQTWQHESTW